MFQSIGDILELLVNQNWEGFHYNVLAVISSDIWPVQSLLALN